MAAIPAHIPFATALRRHRLELAVLDAVGAANRPGFRYSFHRYPDTVPRNAPASAKLRHCIGLYSRQSTQHPRIAEKKSLAWQPGLFDLQSEFRTGSKGTGCIPHGGIAPPGL
jgi:hypothetical protein